MATNAVWIKAEEATFGEKLLQACAQLSNTEGGIVVDCSSVHRISTDELRAMEQLAKTAREKDRKVALRGVTVGVYKVLKVAKLTTHFSFQN